MKKTLNDQQTINEIKDIWRRIFNLINERGTTLYQLCSDTKISYTNIKNLLNSIENDQLTPVNCGIDIFEKISSFFNVPLSYIVQGINYSKKTSIDEMLENEDKNDYLSCMMKIYPYLSLEKKESIKKLIFSFFKK